MSIATEIARIKSAKENIINTLKAKDIQIEETATIDELDVVMNEVPILDTSDATATAGDILKDKTAYVNGEKVVGTLESLGGEYNAVITNTLGKGLSLSGTTNISSVYRIIKKLPEDLTLTGSNGVNMLRGLEGLEELPQNLDTSKITDMKCMFFDCKALKSIPLLNTSNVTAMDNLFQNCVALEGIPLLNTNNVKSMYYMFYNCTNLKNVPLLETKNLYGNMYGLQNTFGGCSSLTDESLNNILAMCKNATNHTSANLMTLKSVGLTSNQATRCQSLSNYQAFLNAGWTTGY